MVFPFKCVFSSPPVFLALVADDPFSHSQLLPKEMVLEEHQLETWQAYMNEVTQPTGVAE